MDLSIEQFQEAIATAAQRGAEAAIRAANVPAGSDRPGGSGGAPAVIKRKPYRYNLGKTLLALRTGDWRGLEMEKEISEATREILEKGEKVDKDAVLMPRTPIGFRTVIEAVDDNIEAPAYSAHRSFSERLGDTLSALRAANEGTGSAGGFLVPPQWLQEAFQFSPQAGIAVRNLPGADVMPVKSNLVYLPRETALPAATTAAEAATLTATDPTFGQQSITIKKVYAYNQFSNELLADSTPEYEAYLARTLVRSVSLQEDLQLMTGNGTGANLTGITNYSGTTTGYAPATNGDSWSATAALDFVINLVYAQRAANIEPNFFLMHPRTLQSLAKVKDSQGRYLLESVGGVFGAPVIQQGFQTGVTSASYAAPKAMLMGYPVFLSAQIPINQTQGTANNATSVILGDANFLRILQRQSIELATSEHINFTTDQTAVRATVRSALALLVPTAFTTQAGIIP